MATSTSKTTAKQATAEEAVPGEDVAVVTDGDGKVHYASAASKFVVDGLAKGKLKPAKVDTSGSDGNGPAAP